MKAPLALVEVLLAGVILFPLFPVSGEVPEPSVPPAQGSSPGRGESGSSVQKTGVGKLTDEEKALLKAVHDKALAQNPALKQQMEEARRALHDAMVRLDPSVETLLSKMSPRRIPSREVEGAGREGTENRRHKESEGPEKNVPPPSVEAVPSVSKSQPMISPSPANLGAEGTAVKDRRPTRPGLSSLTEAERERFKSLRDRVKEDASIQALRDSRKKASTPEERRKIDDSIRSAMNDAMMRLDSSIEPILKKMQEKMQDLPPSHPKR